jgi:hypothetical protein
MKVIVVYVVLMLIWAEYKVITTNPNDLIFIAGFTIFGLYLIVFLILIKMKTKINDDGIFVSYHFFPFNKKKIFLWEDIYKINVIEYSP